MTITSETIKVTANGNDSATVFSFSPIKIYANSELQVTLTTAAGVDTLLTEGTGTTNYSVSSIDFPDTGSITYPATLGTELPTGDKLTITRVMPITQTTDLRNRGAYLAQNVEDALNKATMVSQQLDEALDRSIKLPVSEATITDLDTDTPAASEYLRVNSAGTGIEWTSLSSTTAAASDTNPNATSTAAAPGTSDDFSRYDHVHVDGALAGSWTYTGANVSTNENPITYRWADDGAGVGPNIVLDRNSTSAAAADILAGIAFKGRNDNATPQVVEYANIRGVIQTETDGSERGNLSFNRIIGGAMEEALSLGNVTAHFQNLGVLKVTEETDDATQGPSLFLYRNRGIANVQDADVQGTIEFRADDETSTDQLMAGIYQIVNDATQASLDTSLQFRTKDGGTNRDMLYTGGALVMPGATGGDQGTGTVNAVGLYDDGVQVHPLAVPGAATATTSGTSHEFTGIRSDARRITLTGTAVSLSATDYIEVVLGDSDGYETTGYVGQVGDRAGADAWPTDAIRPTRASVTGDEWNFTIVMNLQDSTTNSWNIYHVGGEKPGSGVAPSGAGYKSLSKTLDRVKIQSSGSDTFDNGTVQIKVE